MQGEKHCNDPLQSWRKTASLQNYRLWICWQEAWKSICHQNKISFASSGWTNFLPKKNLPYFVVVTIAVIISVQINILNIKRFSIDCVECRKTKPKSLWPITKYKDNLANQSKLEVITGCPRKAQENMCEGVMLTFGGTFWLDDKRARVLLSKSPGA